MRRDTTRALEGPSKVAVGSPAELSRQNADIILNGTPQYRSAPSAAVVWWKLDWCGTCTVPALQEERRAAKVRARIESSRSLKLNVRVVIVRNSCLT